MRLRSLGARRALVASALLALAALTVVAGGSAANTPAEAAPTRARIDVKWTPPDFGDGKTTVVVQLSGNPVTLVQADAQAQARATPRSRRSKADLKSKQDALRGRHPGSRRPGARRLPGRLQRAEGADRPLAARQARCAPGGRRSPRPSEGRAGQHEGRPADRRAPGLGRLAGSPRRGHQGRHHRHRHRLHARQLRRPRHGRRVQRGERSRHAAADPALFGPAARASRAASTSSATTTTPTDDPAYQPVPHPDPNPLDCNGHGTHVAGTAAGFGVTADGATYTGPYNADTIAGNSWTDRPRRRAEGRPLRRSASSAAKARPTSSSTRSSGRSTTTWT